MARAVWKGNLSFGLVNIPIALHSAEQSQDFDFDLIDARDHERVHYKRVNARTGREVPWDKIVKGYKYRKGEYVIVDDEDFKRAAPKASDTIEIEEFVDANQVDPIYFDKPYYIQPAKGGEKSYALLYQTLSRTGRVGIGRVVIRKKQHLAAIMARENMLVIETLRFHHEIKDAKYVQAPNKPASVSKRELEMAKKLVEGMTAEWNPAKYKDTYYDDLLEVIQNKVKGGAVEDIEDTSKTAAKPASANVLDIMPLLKKSLEERKRGRRGERTV